MVGSIVRYMCKSSCTERFVGKKKGNWSFILSDYDGFHAWVMPCPTN